MSNYQILFSSIQIANIGFTAKLTTSALVKQVTWTILPVLASKIANNKLDDVFNSFEGEKKTFENNIVIISINNEKVNLKNKKQLLVDWLWGHKLWFWQISNLKLGKSR